MGHFSVEIYALPGSLLSSNQHSGQFYGAVDPLLNRIARTTGDLRTTANQDRTVLRWVNLAAELLLILVTLIAIAGGMLIARLADTRLIKPLSAIAHHVQTAHAADPTDEVPGMGREDEIGAIAHRSEEHTSELQSLMRISYAVFCLKKKT